MLQDVCNTAKITVPTFNSCTKCMGSLGIAHDCTPYCHPFPGHGCIDELKIECSFGSQATQLIDVLGLFSDMLSMGAYTTGHGQTYFILDHIQSPECS